MIRSRFARGLSGRTAGLSSLSLLAVLLGVGIGWTVPEPSVVASSPIPGISEAPQATSRAAALARGSYADLVAEVAPAVVTIRSERVVRANADPFMGDPFEQFFGNQRRGPQRPREEGAIGSGVIVSPDGYILTNHHVVEGASQIRVELTDRRAFDAKVVGSDPPSDLALLKVNATGLRSLRLGDSDRIRVGDVVLAIGNPLGVGQTVTMGIVSAKGRSTGLSDGSFEDFLQTDAPINRGNSGGALVNTDGDLVGINSQILSPSGGSIGIGFAIPARMADHVMQQLVQHGVVRRGQLGVTVQGVNWDLAQSLGLKNVEGALVSAVQPESPADRAGLQRGDVILSFNGTEIPDSNSLRNRVASTEPGSKVTLGVLRDGKTQTIAATLGELAAPRRAANDGTPDGEHGRYGLAVEPLTPDVARQLGVQNATGLVVSDVAPGSAASDAGIRSGDVIQQVNRRPVKSVTELQEALKESGTRPALVLINRQGSDLYVALKGGRARS